MTVTFQIAMLLLVATYAAANDSEDCNGDFCDTQALLQAKVQVGTVEKKVEEAEEVEKVQDEEDEKQERRIVATVDDIDMEAIGLTDDLLDKEKTKIIGGVPFFRYGRAYEGGMNPSLLELAEAKAWIVEWGTATDADLANFCQKLESAGNGKCFDVGDPDHQGNPFVAVQATHDELEVAVKDFVPKPDYVEADADVSAIDPAESIEEDPAGLLETEFFFVLGP